MMSEPVLPADQAFVPTLDQAEVVGKRVEIKGIFLVEGHQSRMPEVDLSEEGISIDQKVSQIEFGLNREQATLFVKVSFALQTLKNGETEPVSRIAVSASFVVLYELKSLDGVEDAHVQSFAGLNSVHNVWPYWREYVQSSTSRMGIQAITTPLLRV